MRSTGSPPRSRRWSGSFGWGICPGRGGRTASSGLPNRWNLPNCRSTIRCGSCTRSGTTGLPKPIVHGQGGILLEHLKKASLHLDAQAGDRMFWFTTTGWMMWNFIVGMLLSDASIVLFDGNPGYPSLATLWDLAADSGMTCFGTSAAFIGACMKDEGLTLRSSDRDLSALRSVGSTGSPLSPEGFQWIYDQLGSDTWLFSTSGGTDMCTAFVGGVPTLPVYLGELQARAWGRRSRRGIPTASR